MKKSEWDTFGFRLDGVVKVVGCNGNSVVTLSSNSKGTLTVGKARMRMRRNGNTDVNRPYIVKSHNSHMAGVDLANRAMSESRPKIKGKYCIEVC